MLGSAGCAAVVTGRAMGTSFRVLADGDRALGRYASARIDQLERRWSRFLPDSEITQLNLRGQAVVSDDTRRLVAAMVTAWRTTGGAYDPTLAGALVGLGYGASRDDPTRCTVLPAGVLARGRPDLITVGEADALVTLPPGTALDPGGIGKGLAADLIVAELLAGGATAALVEIGGDLAVAGEPPDGAWVVAQPDLGVAPLRLASGGVATSTVRRRRWMLGAREQHHLLDPESGQPTRADAITVTVVAGSAATAEAFTKVPFVRGIAAGRAELARLGLAAALADRHDHVATTPAWKEFTT